MGKDEKFLVVNSYLPEVHLSHAMYINSKIDLFTNQTSNQKKSYTDTHISPVWIPTISDW